MKLPLAIIAATLSCTIHAQQTFTEHLVSQRAGEGTVMLHQDAELTALVNGKSRATTASNNSNPSAAGTTATTTSDSSSSDATASASTSNTAGQTRIRTNGYRIQVYAGGNDRASKAEAYRMANLVRSSFPTEAVYTHFISPRWICRVGDYKSYEEANEMLRQMRLTQKFREASIVKSKIVISY